MLRVGTPALARRRAVRALASTPNLPDYNTPVDVADIKLAPARRRPVARRKAAEEADEGGGEGAGALGGEAMRLSMEASTGGYTARSGFCA